jgi:hypothetical protein
LDAVDLAEYKNLAPQWHSWELVAECCRRYATLIFDEILGVE